MSRWTRPQQLAAAGYGVWSAFWTLFVGFVLLTPARPAGVLGALTPAAISLAIGVLAYRGVRWAFWPAMIYFTLVGLGAIWVPLRPQAHAGEDGLTLFVHAFVADLPGLFVGGWLVVALIRTARA
ncbi:hypothetical protein ABZX92_19730 [Lentzea sp. NPDC006480]|uniref:hypothetical protein n=1 Tax=Lentzea sp. NPDC006480 TaxID=3157176 RepID=UPI0033AC261C